MSTVADAFVAVTGNRPAGVWTAPGRVNLIGEHTDYNDGLALPFAIDRAAAVAVGLRQDRHVRCRSLQMPTPVTVSLDDLEAGRLGGWAAYALGALWALARAGVAVPGVELVIDSNIPVGAGLGSSAAVEVAVALAVAEVSGQALSHDELARCCRAGEESIAGAPTGLMDQLVALEGSSGHALFVDFRSLERELVPLRPDELRASLVVIDTTVAHATGGADYRARREECARAARELGVPSLRDAGSAEVAGLAGTVGRRARHVVTENARVRQAVRLLRAGALQQVGALLEQSHASLRDDFEVSCGELDLAVATATAAGAWGARMTGAGFGGCGVALVPSSSVAEVGLAVTDAFERARFSPPDVFAVSTADGARRCA